MKIAKNIVVLCLVLGLVFVACGQPTVLPSTAISEPQELKESLSSETASSKPKGQSAEQKSDLAEDGTAQTLTAQQEDFRYFWATLEENYPFMGVARRQGILVDTIYQRYYSEITPDMTNQEFRALMESAAGTFGGAGHLSFLPEGPYFTDFYMTYSTAGDSKTQHLLSVLEKGLEKGAYSLLTREQEGEIRLQAQPGNIRTEILEENKIGYVSIATFGLGNVEEDAPTLTAFYQQVQDYPHLIIDIRGNGGGSDMFWMDNIVGPLLQEPVTDSSYLLYRDTTEMTAYLEAMPYFSSHPLEQLPLYDRLPPEDQTHLTNYVEIENSISPVGEGFAGKIWVLVDSQVYSASESFAMFCKNTGFATLVGTPTGGDGGGVDPLLFCLPHSGLIWRNSVFYTINSDGTNSEEFGTTPDILLQGGDALSECLRQIGEDG